jgi:virginiamycin A acetyltransferase
VVCGNVESYTIIIRNLAMILRKIFYGDFINLLRKFGSWDKNIEKINEFIPILTCMNLERVKVK